MDPTRWNEQCLPLSDYTFVTLIHLNKKKSFNDLIANVHPSIPFSVKFTFEQDSAIVKQEPITVGRSHLITKKHFTLIG